VNEEGITAEFTDGVLHLTLPKETQEVQKVKTIEIK
jgi:HSP20 family molecular chaperone IbpA